MGGGGGGETTLLQKVQHKHFLNHKGSYKKDPSALLSICPNTFLDTKFYVTDLTFLEKKKKKEGVPEMVQIGPKTEFFEVS